MSKYWEVIEPTKNKWQWRLCAGAEAKVGEIGREIESMVDFYQQTQRKLEFQDETVYWFYPCWLNKLKVPVEIIFRQGVNCPACENNEPHKHLHFLADFHKAMFK